MRFILCVDGGGGRGAVPTGFLAKFEETLPFHLSEGCDLIAGVSTGGIIGAALSAPVKRATGRKLRAADILDFYVEDLPVIFKKRWLRSMDMFRPKYDADVLLDKLQRRFPNALLSQTDTEFLVTAYAMNHWTAMQFCTSKAKSDQQFDFRLSDVAFATSLAPTYFGSRLIVSVDGSRTLECIDGGVARNNVTTLAIAHARKLWPGERLFVLSLGTGVPKRPPAGSGQARKWGLLKWAPRVIPTFMDATSDFVIDEMRVFADDSYRINFSADNGMAEMDNASPENIDAMLSMADELWARHEMALKGRVATAMIASYTEREKRLAAGIE